MRYLVFARRRYEDPLELCAEVSAEGDEAAARAARDAVGAGWIEVRLLPAAAARWVIRREAQRA